VVPKITKNKKGLLTTSSKRTFHRKGTVLRDLKKENMKGPGSRGGRGGGRNELKEWNKVHASSSRKLMSQRWRGKQLTILPV